MISTESTAELVDKQGYSMLERLLKARASTRAFLDKPVSEERVKRLLTSAGLSASGGNLQPWKVYALAGSAKQQLIEAIKERIALGQSEDQADIAVYPENLISPYRERRFECGMALYKALNIEREDTAARTHQWQANFEFFGAPVGLIFTMNRQMEPAQFMDMGIYLQSLMLLAQEAGLNTCPQLSWSAWANTVREVLKIDSEEAVIVGMSLGYGDQDAAVNQYRTDRCGLNEFASILVRGSLGF